MRLIEHCLSGGSSVAGKAFAPSSGDRCDRASFAVNAPYDVVLHFHEVHVSLAIKTNLVWLIKLSIHGRAAIARIAESPATCDGRYFSGHEVEAADAMVSHFSNVQGAVRTYLNSKRITNVDTPRWSGISVVFGRAGSGDRLDGILFGTSHRT
jgi:hypothetical protein